MDGSGSNPKPEKDQLSALRCPSDERRADIHGHVLIVEDNKGDVSLIEEAIETTRLALTLHVVNDGEQAVRFFDRIDSDPDLCCPALVILDINLPKKQGDEVLKHMRQSRRCARSLVIAISTSNSARDREKMTTLGVDGYFHKPSDYNEFMKLGDMIKAVLGRALPQ